MIWVGSTFYPGTGLDWNLPREIQNPPAYAMQSDKSQYILQSTGLEGYGRMAMGWKSFRHAMPVQRVRGLAGNLPLRGYIPLRGYGQQAVIASSGTPARLTCARTPEGFVRCNPRYTYSWDDYANRIQL